jgi:hypothetical protein
MAAVVRRLSLRPGVGERLLMTKLQILAGTGGRRPGVALSILTGRLSEHLSIEDIAALNPIVSFHAPVSFMLHRTRRHYAARTVYLSESHLHDIERIIEAWQQVAPRRLTRSAVLRRAVEHLRAAVEADTAKFLLENDSSCPTS